MFVVVAFSTTIMVFYMPPPKEVVTTEIVLKINRMLLNYRRIKVIMVISIKTLCGRNQQKR